MISLELPKIKPFSLITNFFPFFNWQNLSVSIYLIFIKFSHVLYIQQFRMKLFMILCALMLASALPSRKVYQENLLKNLNADVGHHNSHSRSYERYRYRRRYRFRRPYSPYNAYDPYGTFDYQYGNNGNEFM